MQNRKVDACKPLDDGYVFRWSAAASDGSAVNLAGGSLLRTST